MPLIAFAALLAFYLYRYAFFTGWRVGSDGFYSWMFARSLAFDGDIHFANDYAVCGDPFHLGVDEGGGRPANPFYFGPALIWTPAVWLARHLIHFGPHASAAERAGCYGPIANNVLVLAPLCAVSTLWLGYRLARRWASPRASVAAAVTVGLCTPLLHFGTLVATYSHVWAAFGVALAALLWIRASEEPASLVRWFAAGVGIGLAALMRMQASVMLLAPAMLLASIVVQDVRSRRLRWQPFIAGLLVLTGFASLIWIQFVAYKILYGHWWVVPQGHAYVQWGHGQPMFLLFSARSSLFYWHPLHWLGALGAALLVARRDRRLHGACLLLPIVIDVYIGSASEWHAGASFGARRLTSLAGPWTATTAVFLAWAWAWLRAKPTRIAVFAAVGWLWPWVVINTGASNGSLSRQVPYDAPAPMPQLYGTAFRLGLDGIYRAMGNPFTLPAGVVFAARYRLPPRRFDDFSTGGMFEHHYRPVTLRGPDTLSLAYPASDPFMVDGFRRVPDGGMVRAGARARLLLELSWGHITHVEIAARAERATPVTVRVRNAGFFRTRDVGTFVTPPRGSTVELAVSDGVFDAGINEITFVGDGDFVIQSWRWVDRGRHDTALW